MNPLGTAITYLLQVLRDVQKRSMTEVMVHIGQRIGVSSSTIHKWREGSLRPSIKAVETLVEIAVVDAHLDETWVRTFLQLSQHPHADMVIQRYFSATQPVLHNLPQRYESFVKRDDEIAEIERRLMDRFGQSLIAIVGIPGLGKTTMALEVGWRCVERFAVRPEPARFNAVVWISGRRNRLTMQGVKGTFRSSTNMRDIYDTVAEVLQETGFRIDQHGTQIANAALSPEEEDLRQWNAKKRHFATMLRNRGRVLLIIDDVEDIKDEEVDSFLADLPASLKVILTSQVPGNWEDPIRPRLFSRQQMIEQLRDECAAHAIDFDVLFPDEQAVNEFITVTGHIPLVCWWAIGMIAVHGKTRAEVVADLSGYQREQVAESQTTSDALLHFIFESFLEQCRKRNLLAYRTLLALVRYDEHGATIDDLAEILQRTPAECRIPLKMLRDFQLVWLVNDRYILPRLVMNYMQHEIQSPENIAWEKRTRKHWVESNFASIRAELKDTKERDWATAFDHLETIKPTLCGKNGVFEWCFDHLDDYYPAVAALWLDEGYGRYAMYYGHWPELLHYLDLLIKEANQRKDRLHEFKALIIHTHLSTLMYHHPKALESKMQRAEYLSATYPAEIPTYWRHRAVITRAFLYSREKKYAEAIAVLRDLEPQFQAIRDTLDHPHSAEDGLDVERDMLRCAGELWYRCGMTYYYAALAQHDDDALEQAAHYFELAWAICEQQHFQHTMFMTINYLIHVELEMGHLDRAQWLFDTYWESVQQAKEERRIAGFRFVHARLIWETCQITGIATPSTRIALEVSQEVERALTTYEHLHMFYEQRRIRIFARQVLEDIASLLPANALADPLDSQQIHPTLQQATVILHEMVEAA